MFKFKAVMMINDDSDIKISTWIHVILAAKINKWDK